MTDIEAEQLLSVYLRANEQLALIAVEAARLLAGPELKFHRLAVGRAIMNLNDGIEAVCMEHPKLRPDGLDP